MCKQPIPSCCVPGDKGKSIKKRFERAAFRRVLSSVQETQRGACPGPLTIADRARGPWLNRRRLDFGRLPIVLRGSLFGTAPSFSGKAAAAVRLLPAPFSIARPRDFALSISPVSLKTDGKDYGTHALWTPTRKRVAKAGGNEFVLTCRPLAPFDWYHEEGEFLLSSTTDLHARNGKRIFWHARYRHPVPCPRFLASDDDKALPAGQTRI